MNRILAAVHNNVADNVFNLYSFIGGGVEYLKKKENVQVGHLILYTTDRIVSICEWKSGYCIYILGKGVRKVLFPAFI